MQALLYASFQEGYQLNSMTLLFFVLYKTFLNIQSMINYIVSIDYLKIFTNIKYLRIPKEFEFTDLERGSVHYARVQEIRLFGEKIATMESQPRSPMLDVNSALIKFENRLLYMPYRNDYIDFFMKSCNVEFRNITRIDIAIDLTEFEKDLSPKKLINNFITEKYLKVGRGQFTIIGDMENVKCVDYLRFGSKKSDIEVYLYNKTKELHEVVYKPYIVENWKDLKGATKKDVWRLEFSMKAEGCTYLNEDSGEIVKLDLSILKDTELQFSILKELIYKYFRFKENDNTMNKSRMKDVLLLNLKGENFRRISLKESTDVLKKDKILMKNVYVLEKEFDGIDDETKKSAKKIVEFMRRNEYLNEYFEKKKTAWDKVRARH